MTNPHGRPPLSGREKFALAIASLGILLISAAVAAYMLMNRPQPERRRQAPGALIVSVQELESTSQQIRIPVMGSVVPAVQVDLKSRVTGEVIWVHPGAMIGIMASGGPWSQMSEKTTSMSS